MEIKIICDQIFGVPRLLTMSVIIFLYCSRFPIMIHGLGITFKLVSKLFLCFSSRRMARKQLTGLTRFLGVRELSLHFQRNFSSRGKQNHFSDSANHLYCVCVDYNFVLFDCSLSSASWHGRLLHT